MSAKKKGRKTTTKLSLREQRFVAAFLKSLNATEAAIDAGYSERTAAQQATRLMKVPRVKAAIAAGQQQRLERAKAGGDRIVEELERLALVDIGDIIDFNAEVPMLKAANTIPESARRAIQSVKVKRYLEGKGKDAKEVEVIEFKLHDKGSNLTTLMRHHGLLIDKVKIEDDVTEEELEQRLVAMLRTAAARKKAGALPGSTT